MARSGSNQSYLLHAAAEPQFGKNLSDRVSLNVFALLHISRNPQKVISDDYNCEITFPVTPEEAQLI